MRFNPRARVDQSQTEHRTGGRPGGGTLTIGGIAVLGVVFLINQLTGVDISSLIPDGSSGDGSTTEASTCRTGEDANKSDQCAIDLITTSVQSYWSQTLPEQGGPAYKTIKTITFSGSTSSGCGAAQAAMGPFYCPTDQRVYLDVNFMDDMLKGDLGAKGGDFALGYVIAHEYGHHIEHQLGLLSNDSATGPRSKSVATELMADCLGGMWAKDAGNIADADGNKIIEDLTADDIALAVDAAQAVGDDRIQQSSGGGVNEESWTHGSSAERVAVFEVGLQQGSIQACLDHTHDGA